MDPTRDYNEDSRVRIEHLEFLCQAIDLEGHGIGIPRIADNHTLRRSD
jgi:hypothetical protein